MWYADYYAHKIQKRFWAINIVSVNSMQRTYRINFNMIQINIKLNFLIIYSLINNNFICLRNSIHCTADTHPHTHLTFIHISIHKHIVSLIMCIQQKWYWATSSFERLSASGRVYFREFESYNSGILFSISYKLEAWL